MTAPTDPAARLQVLRAALEKIADSPCTGRVPGCNWSRTEACPKHIAEAALAADDWVAA